MSSYHFHCTGCGRCCVGAPEMTLVEAALLYREFVPMLRIGGAPDFDNVPLAHQQRAMAEGLSPQAFREQYEHIVGLGAITIKAGGVRIAVRLSAAPVAPPSLARCPRLGDDGRCTIWDRRPSLCRALPLDSWSPESRQDVRLRAMARHVTSDGYDCDMGETAPEVWRDGVIVDPAARADWEDGVRRCREEWPVLSVVRAEMESAQSGLPSLAQVGGAVLAGDAYHLDFLGAFTTLHVFRDSGSAEKAGIDLSGLPTHEDFLSVQLDLIRAQIAGNISRRSPADRTSTTHLRNLERHYAQALAERSWESDEATP